MRHSVSGSWDGSGLEAILDGLRDPLEVQAAGTAVGGTRAGRKGHSHDDRADAPEAVMFGFGPLVLRVVFVLQERFHRRRGETIDVDRDHVFRPEPSQSS